MAPHVLRRNQRALLWRRTSGVGHRFLSGDNDGKAKPSSSPSHGGIWDQFKREAAQHEDLSNAVNSLKQKAHQASAETQKLANRARESFRDSDMASKASEFREKHAGNVYNEAEKHTKSMMSRLCDLVRSTKSTVASKFEDMVESVDPKVVEKATRVAESARGTVGWRWRWREAL